MTLHPGLSFLKAAVHVVAAMSLTMLSVEGALGQTVRIDGSTEGRMQIIDGFGAHQGGDTRNQDWWQELYYDDMRASIYRIDLTPDFVSPYSDYRYYSPWFHNNPPLPGPDDNRVRTYTSYADYTDPYAGRTPPIAVMGPDIDANIELLDFAPNGAIEAGTSRLNQLGDFKLVGSLWSPSPWVKISSGNRYGHQDRFPYPVGGTPWPFVWGGNFAGGRLDVSEEPIAAFDDTHLGGSGPTSALTQFARTMAAYLRGYQQEFDVRFYAISIQNELNFEEFYNSCTYPLSEQYIKALKYVRAELDKYPDLEGIRIMGPEDLLGGDPYGMWQYGGGNDVTHKNLQYLRNIAADPEADEAVDFFCIHGYDSDGVTSSGADPTLWNWWVNGWNASPAAGIPPNVNGFAHYGKKSWMTETSGENWRWLVPQNSFPNRGAFSVAMKIHQALTAGMQSAWIYWTFADGDDTVSDFGLTNERMQGDSPKYVAAKHYFRYIRPNAVRVEAASDVESLWSSAYVHDEDGTLTAVLVNTSDEPAQATVELPAKPSGISSFQTFTSEENALWQESSTPVEEGAVSVTVPGYGITTLYGEGVPFSSLPGGRPGQLVPTYETYPNPSTGTSHVSFVLQESAPVRLAVYDALGREVAVLVDEVRPPGRHTLEHSTTDLLSGVYFYRLSAGNVEETRRVAVVR